MDLFEHNLANQLNMYAPLADRMRPDKLEDFIGQDQIIGKGSPLRGSISNGLLPSIILWGPPGTGKTTLANILAAKLNAKTHKLSAVSSGVSDIRNAINSAIDLLGMLGQKSILFIDEIHRFSKSQQDVILPFVENGTVTLIGATTENPSFEVIAPLLSRCKVFTLNPLHANNIVEILNKAILDPINGLGQSKTVFPNETLEMLADSANGDARWALNTLELMAMYKQDGIIDTATAVKILTDKPNKYDKNGDMHYDSISAFIKSVRGSNPNAALYWLARMLEGGENLNFITRRLIILASEDIGLADPNALSLSVAAQQAVNFVGLPESRIILSEITIYLAAAPKSNTAYMAINNAQAEVNETGPLPIPLHLRNPVTKFMETEGYGKNYIYPHNTANGFSDQAYLPEGLKNVSYYNPKEYGYESKIKTNLEKLDL
jgi:putative ATPase